MLERGHAALSTTQRYIEGRRGAAEGRGADLAGDYLAAAYDGFWLLPDLCEPRSEVR